jgi:hypothetical protein
MLDEHAERQHGERRLKNRKPAERLLRERARDRRFRQLLDALPAAVYTTNAWTHHFL